MLPCDAKKNYNPCAVSVNKYEPCTLGRVFILRCWEGPGPGTLLTTGVRGAGTKKEHRDCDAL